ncbi:hypothetical protein ACP4OV_014999 [Aristida adscensionis]
MACGPIQQVIRGPLVACCSKALTTPRPWRRPRRLAADAACSPPDALPRRRRGEALARIDAHDVLDGMPPPEEKRKKEDEVARAEAAGDRVGALPDALLHHVLLFLPAEEAVRTCVLARRWRSLWRSAAGLRIGCLREHEPTSVKDLRRFVEYLLLLRGGAPLDTCELQIGDFRGRDDVPRVNLWFRHAVLCKVRALKLHVHNSQRVHIWLELDDLPLVSQHLTRLQLHGVRCHASFLNFSSCPSLEHLEFEYCDFSVAKKISSKSIRSLTIIFSAFPINSRIRISAPNLVSLHLDDLWDKTPILDSMPALSEAFVRITNRCDDYCSKLLVASEDCDCEACKSSHSIGNGGNNCVILKGLSEAKSLVLISRPELFIFKRDLRRCPTFSNLKTLLLNDYWCVPDDLHELACLLKHSPVLEKLTLQLFSEGPNHKMEMRGIFNSMERSAGISEYLKIVEIKCEVIDERVFKVLKFLCTFNIHFSC